VFTLSVEDLKSVMASESRDTGWPFSPRVTDSGGFNSFPVPGEEDRPYFKWNLSRISPTAFIEYSPVYSDEIELALYEAVVRRLGRPYRLQGTDDRGYDCSGFVWRVFHDAGVGFDRNSTSKLWQTLPRATKEETTRFGTLVFFKGLTHVGIMRDAHSFYHASTSQGVVHSYLDNYWKSRVIGHRRVFAPIRRTALAGRP
jgi:hypothetical protein